MNKYTQFSRAADIAKERSARNKQQFQAEFNMCWSKVKLKHFEHAYCMSRYYGKRYKCEYRFYECPKCGYIHLARKRKQTKTKKKDNNV